jgi:lipopolysaccharide export LptBFGC system permease protein LptF
LEVNLRLVVAALAAVGTLASTAQAAPRAESAMECGVAADMAVVAHSLAREDIQRPKADAIMVRIYDVAQSDRGMELMRDITDAAYTAKQREPSASAGGTGTGTASSQKFAEELYVTCMKSGGDMDPILGRKS